ncbi:MULTISPECIES: SEL1-like repeat protein [unclassified Massilia]|uniref:tetratricopeptide repeat protein n=1 Tax=unclassified Massilia TaxID=2609279 RepID=UPI0017803B13|nr:MULTISPECIES: SEL1-like repeat protein [unclassified Massilia]MBD8532405.1 sel1 repeat family protein [Massilia sp. CFBP 13647]MBD8675769.1 sel1 repeat family protein [Massilia sp. CFBP 13721]
MANREELAIIRGARSGRADAQLELGKRYLFGSAGLPRSLPTALHWLDRAARQDCAESCELIGSHIPLDLARVHATPLAPWYERAYDGGNVRAGLVLAQLLLEDGRAAPDALRNKALRALEEAARAGFAEAQWLLARRPDIAASVSAACAAQGPAKQEAVAAVRGTAPLRERAGQGERRTAGRPGAGALDAQPAPDQPWLRRAADNGLAEAQFALLEQSWAAAAWQDYLARALPLARALVDSGGGKQIRRLAPGEVTLLSRTARLLADGKDGAAAGEDVGNEEVHAFWELAAAEHDRHAQLAIGLWYARMQVDGARVQGGSGAANFKKAIRWLLLAGEQGLAEAWYALSRIYLKPEFSQRNVADAQRYLEKAAEMGYQIAQLECGNNAWRARRENESNDVRAVFWLQQAAAQGNAEAAAAIRRIAPRPEDAAHTETGALLGCVGDLTAHPLLAARLELAALFGLTRAETLLLDVAAADQGHCLVVDIRASYGRSKRRLVMVDTAQERQTLDRIVRLFENVDCGPGGPEGNYRQRLYRLRTLMADAAMAGRLLDSSDGRMAPAGKPERGNAAYGMAA